ncbi:MAG TPA: bifunctional alpha,alpha-trehalose-phosphate synthase (UDP-forming)/trehalose-phosphatase [Chitinophagaceae bacterium]|nr:bifunctional alpha,alpha-trehalose-phosphate synthase (UDP-forming)/trehalose-phosphatase [Chitinophagaceae bacterium]
MNETQRLFIVANRLPVQEAEKGRKKGFRQSSGGLVSALKSYFDRTRDSGFARKSWIGIADFRRESWEKWNQGHRDPGDFELLPLFIDEALYDGYYNGFSNSVLWPLFHYFPTYASFQLRQFEAYRQVNQLFAERIAAEAQPGDVVWVHDYHLFLLPGLLRRLRPDLTIGFFLHIPFPHFEIFRQIPRPWCLELLEGLLGADLIGFHTIEYRRYFQETVQMILHAESDFGQIYYQDRLIRADLFPIGIDTEKFRLASADPRVETRRQDIRQNFPDQKLIFSLDRLDYTKGVLQRLSGFANFLDHHPEWHGRVVMLLNVIPSRDRLSKYTERKRLIEERVSSVNGRFSNYRWQPIVYFYRHLEFDHLCSFYQVADVALITPLRDGMNLVAKEYVASRHREDGALILSELAGAANELGEAFLVNPFDETEVATAIYQSLTLPADQQQERMRRMQARLRDYDVHRWVEDFLQELRLSRQLQQARSNRVLDERNRGIIREKMGEARRRLLLLDYDGTLRPFARHPLQALPDAALMRLLDQLAGQPDQELAIISGRDSATLENWLGSLPVILVAEHGALIKYPERPWSTLLPVSTDWKQEVLPTLERFTRRCHGSFLEEKEYAIAWHYRNMEKQLGFSRSRELLQNLSVLLANRPLQVLDGNQVVEVRSAHINKGLVARTLADTLEADFILCMGDDKTDEDMFQALRESAVTIKIGSGQTAARFTIPRQQDVTGFLESLLDLHPKYSRHA